jgi:hypothetical protein
MVAVGLSPRTAAKHTIRRRGATAERSNKTVALNRRSATHDHNTPPLRGVKSTATIMASLREVTQGVGWNESGALHLGNATIAALDAESAEALGNIKALL